MPPKTLKSRKVAKATGVSDKKVSDYLVRLIEKTAKNTEFPAQVQKKLGDGRFLVKNLVTNSELTVTLSKSLYINKRSARNEKVQVAINLGNIVLVDDELITAKFSSSMWALVKGYLDLPRSAENSGFVFNVNALGGTRKNRRNKRM